MNYNRLKSVSLCVLIFILSGLIYQTNAQSIEWGVIGGINVSTHIHKFRFIDEDVNVIFTPKTATGFHAGFIARKELSRSLRLQLEPSLTLLGARYDETFQLRGFDFETESRTKLLYLQLPLLLQITSIPSQETVFGRPFARTTYHVSGGFFGGYQPYARFSGTNTGTPLGIDFEGDFSNDISSQYSKFDGGVIFGIGFEHGSGNKVGFETRALYSAFDLGEYGFDTQNLAFTFCAYILL